MKAARCRCSAVCPSAVSTIFSLPNMLPLRLATWKSSRPAARVDANALIEKGIIKKTLDGVKVLGNGTLTKALNVKLTAYSASAKEKIEKAGGKAEVI